MDHYAVDLFSISGLFFRGRFFPWTLFPKFVTNDRLLSWWWCVFGSRPVPASRSDLYRSGRAEDLCSSPRFRSATHHHTLISRQAYEWNRIASRLPVTPAFPRRYFRRQAIERLSGQTDLAVNARVHRLHAVCCRVSDLVKNVQNHRREIWSWCSAFNSLL